jgi:ElaB/YqjD/DUF883 family membrane-anchored ribosome-binding protein
MINRLPDGFKVTTPTGGVKPAGELVGEREAASSFPTRLLGAAANTVGKRPLASLGVAFVTGILLGKLVKR